MHIAGPWITSLEEEIVLDALRNGWYGDKAYAYVEKFEATFADYHGRAYALMTPNCTSALHLLMQGLGIGGGDEVIVPECTWIASAAPIVYQRATPIFADIDAQSWCLSPESLCANITSRTKAVVAVNLYGNMCDMDTLQTICREKSILLIEDAAESIGSTYKNIRSGKFGVGSVFSFHRTKTLTTGEGGMLLIDDQKLYERCKLLRDHGRAPGSYYQVEVTHKYMPSNLAASLGYAQFQRLSDLVDRKRWIWKTYAKYLSDVPDLCMNEEPEHVFNSTWCTTMVLGENHGLTRDFLMDALSQRELPSRPFFYPLSSLPAFGGREKQGQVKNPVAYNISSRGICLPSALNITEEDIQRMSVAIVEILKENSQLKLRTNVS